MKISVIGSGTWGTALSQSLARSGHDVCLWCFVPEHAEAINKDHYNPASLKDSELSPLIHATSSLEEACTFSDQWLFVTPTQFLRPLLEKMKPWATKNIQVADAAKGIEIASLKLISQIVREILPDVTFTAISGPSHAEEVIRNLPVAVVAASHDPAAAALWQRTFNRPEFRVYTSDDVEGVETGGAVKNVIAIASGVLHSLEMGDNATAAMVTRGLAEIKRLGVALGGRGDTFSGLAGMGDLIVTAYSRHSRNFRLGEMIGQGKGLEESRQILGQVAEGAYTVQAVKKLSAQLGVDMPLNDAVYAILYEGKPLKEVMSGLMSRAPKPED